MDDGTGFLRTLIGAGRDGEAAVQDLVAARLAALGCVVERVRYRPSETRLVREFAGPQAMPDGEREAVVGRLAGRGGGRSVVLFAHPDGEPHGDLSGWTRDPFTGVVAQGRLYGFGVADDLAGVASAVDAIARLRESGVAPAGDIVVASTPSKRHARGVHALLARGLRADAAVYLHPAESGVGMREVKTFCSGQLDGEIVVTGRPPETVEPSHLAFAHRAVNALDKAALVHTALRRLDARRGERLRHPVLEAEIGRSTNLIVSSIASEPTGAMTRVPERATLAFSMSLPPGEALEAAMAEVRAAVEAAADDDTWLGQNRPELRFRSGVEGAALDADHPLYLTAVGAIRTVTGEAARSYPLHTASDVRVPINQAGIPTIGFGPLCGDLTQNGGCDEWVDAADYRRAVEVTALLVENWTA